MEMSRAHRRGEVGEMMMVVGVAIMEGGENTTPVDAITTLTAVEMAVIDMAATGAEAGTTIEVMAETGDMMDATMVVIVIIVTTTRADILTTEGGAAGVMIMEGEEMSRGEDAGADPENAGIEGGGTGRVLLGLGAEAMTERPNVGIVVVVAASRTGADRAAAPEAKADRAVEV